MAEHRQEFERELEAIEANVIELFAMVAEDLPGATRYLTAAQGYARSLELYAGGQGGSTTGTGGAVSDRGIPGEAVFRTGSAATTYRAGEGQAGAGGERGRRPGDE